jgi:hypothetical protein
MEADEQLFLAKRTVQVCSPSNIDEIDRTTFVEASHEADFPNAQRARAIKPNGQLMHGG